MSRAETIKPDGLATVGAAPAPWAQARLTLVGTLLYVCGGGPTYVMPDYLSAAGRALRLSGSQIGWLSGDESLGIALGCILAGWLAARMNWLVVVAAAAVCVAGDRLFVVSPDFRTLLLDRFVTGLAGEGPLYALGYIVLSSAARPHRAFGVALTGVALMAAATLYGEGWLGGVFGDAGALAPCAGAAVILAVLMAWSRSTGAAPHSAANEAAAKVAPPVRYDAVAILVSIAAWAGAAGAFWAFSETAADAVRVAPAVIAEALSIGVIAGLAGTAAPILLEVRYGRLAPLAVATIGMVGASVLFFASTDLLRLALALALVQFCWNLATVYQLAGLAGVDPDGRYSALGAVAQLAGLALGPAVAGLLVAPLGYSSVTLVLTVGVAVGLALFWLAARWGPPTAPAR